MRGIEPEDFGDERERRAHPDMDPVRASELDAVWRALEDDACFEVMSLPGSDGQWIVIIAPYCE